MDRDAGHPVSRHENATLRCRPSGARREPRNRLSLTNPAPANLSALAPLRSASDPLGRVRP